MPTVEYEVSGSEFPRFARDLPEGTPVELEYDSAYGGTVTERGALERIERRERMTAAEAHERGAARPGDLVVGDRIIEGSRVRSARDRRRIGRAELARVQVPRERALDHIASQSSGHDVDETEGATIVQFWGSEYGSSAYLPHIEDGERVNDLYEPKNYAARGKWTPLGP